MLTRSLIKNGIHGQEENNGSANLKRDRYKTISLLPALAQGSKSPGGAMGRYLQLPGPTGPSEKWLFVRGTTQISGVISERCKRRSPVSLNLSSFA